MRAPSREKRMDDSNGNLYSVKYEVADLNMARAMEKNKDINVLKIEEGKKGKIYVTFSTPNKDLADTLVSENNKENYQHTKENICIYKKRCPNLKCNGCQNYTPRRPLSLNTSVNENEDYDVEDSKTNIEDIVIRKEQINEALKKLQKVDAVLARIAKMVMASDTCEFIAIKTGIPKSTVNDMLEKAEKILSNNT